MTTIPTDPIDFIVKEKWITATVIGSIFTFALVSKFKDSIFDPLMSSMIHPKSFDFMKVKIPGEDENELDFGSFFRETIIWIIMVFVLYILTVLFSFPITKGGSSGVAVM